MQATEEFEATPGSGALLHDLFREYHRLILQSARRITGSQADAEDVLQTVFLRLARHSNLRELGPGAKSYLRRAAVNAALDIVRRRGIEPVAMLGLEVSASRQTPVAQPDQILDRSELREWLRAALSRMNETAAEVFALKYFEGYGNTEIAEIVGTSPGTVAVTLHRTRNRLRNEIESLLGGSK